MACPAGREGPLPSKTSSEPGYDQGRAADRDGIFQKRDRKVLAAGRPHQPYSKLVAAESAYDGANNSGHQTAGQGTERRPDCTSAQGARHQTRDEPWRFLAAGCLRQLVGDQLSDGEYRQDVRRYRSAEKGEP